MSKISLTKKYLINGPENIVRLTNGNKIVYIFGDIHNDITNQSQCGYNPEIDNIDVDKLLFKIFKKNPDRQFDFFYESFIDLDPKNVDNDKERFIKSEKFYKNRYFNEVMSVVFSNINFIDNKIHVSKHIPNLRLHYFNFRSSFRFIQEFHFDIENQIHNLKNSYKFNQIIDIFEYIKSKLLETINELDNNYYVKKIKSKYQNTDINKKMLKIYDTYVVKKIYNAISIIDTTTKYINKTPELFNKYITDEKLYELNKPIYTNILSLIQTVISIFSFLTDIFLIRRLLDKDYIKNSVIYCGGNHMIFITYILITYFDFKLTHIANNDKNIDNDSIDKTSQIIKNKNINEFNDFVYLQQYLFNNSFQCSNLFKFPDNLL